MEIEEGETAGKSEGESADGGDGGEAEDSGVNAVWGVGETAGAGDIAFLGECAGEIRLPPLDGAGAGDWATVNETKKAARRMNPRDFERAIIREREREVRTLLFSYVFLFLRVFA